MIHRNSSIVAGIAAIGVLTSLCSFAAPAVYTAGDLFMGFRATGGANPNAVYVVNLGQAGTYRDATTTITPNLGDINQDLTDLFGSDWQTNATTNVIWGIACAPSNTVAVNGDNVPTLYASKLLNTVGSPGTGWVVAGSSNRINVATNMDTFMSHFADYQQTANSTKAVIQDASENFAWSKFMAPVGAGTYTSGNLDFGAFAEIEASASQKLSLFRVTNASAGTYKGYFAISATGVLTFTPPSTGTSYATWATNNASGQAANVDTDRDGVANGIEWFTGSSTNPSIVSGSITWPRASGTATATSVFVQTSTDLVAWTNQGGNRNTGSGAISYTLPTGQAKIFVRLNVTP